MSRRKLKVHTTDVSNLVSNIRGEVGEIITSWIFLRDFKLQAQKFRTNDFKKDFQNLELDRLNFLCNKFEDEIIARLSELGEKKIGQICFYFASVKFNGLSNEVAEFEAFILKEKFRDRRNNYISHKNIPLTWEDHKLATYIPYKIILKAIVLAIRLMKKIDNLHLGPSAKYLWHEMRKRRYEFFYPPQGIYMVLPYLHLPDHIRLKIVAKEIMSGKQLLVEIPTKINGKNATVRVCKEWGVIQIGNNLIALKQYPLIKLDNIEIN